MSASTLIVRKLDLRLLWTGAAAGIIGGIPFGMMMWMMGMLPMVGMLVRSESALAGMLVHALISAATGALYGVLAFRLPQTWRTAALAGLVYGVIWWVLGALILMPALLGMFQNILVIGQVQWFSLMGHIVFGMVLAIAFRFLYPRSSAGS